MIGFFLLILLIFLSLFFFNKYPQIEIKEIDKFIEQLYENFEENKTTQLTYFEDFAAMCIFRVPKIITLPADEPIRESLQQYSVEEDEKLDKRIEDLQKSIQSVRKELFI